MKNISKIVDDVMKEAVSPEGWGKTVEKMKKHPEIDNPFALAYWMKDKGYKPHYKETNVNKKAQVKNVNPVSPNSPQALKATTKIYFNDQKLLNLWENEISGQISDGAWENSPKTEWLWRDSVALKGPKNEIVVPAQWYVGKQSFGWKQILDVVKDRMIEENGFKDENELKLALAIISTMIKTPRIDDSISKLREQQVKTEQEQKIERIKKFVSDKPEWKLEYNSYHMKMDDVQAHLLFNLKSVNENGIVSVNEEYDGRIGGRGGFVFKAEDYEKVFSAIKQLAKLIK